MSDAEPKLEVVVAEMESAVEGKQREADSAASGDVVEEAVPWYKSEEPDDVRLPEKPPTGVATVFKRGSSYIHDGGNGGRKNSKTSFGIKRGSGEGNSKRDSRSTQRTSLENCKWELRFIAGEDAFRGALARAAAAQEAAAWEEVLQVATSTGQYLNFEPDKNNRERAAVHSLYYR